jgi:nitrate reductase gamma subunit
MFKQLIRDLISYYADYIILVLLMIMFFFGYTFTPGDNTFYERILDTLIGAFLGVFRSLHGRTNNKVNGDLANSAAIVKAKTKSKPTKSKPKTAENS